MRLTGRGIWGEPKDPEEARRVLRRAVELGVAHRARFLAFVSLCFRQKRKTLRNNLAPIYGKERIDQLDEAGLRAEQMSVADLAAIYRKLA